MKTSEQKIYGRNACIAFAKKNSDAVIRAYCTESTQPALGFLLKKLAQSKRAYHIVSTEDLSKISESEHHEGMMLLVHRQEAGSESTLLLNASRRRGKPELLLCLDGISNPHNLGSIVRTAAHFGIQDIVLMNIADEQIKGLLSGSYHRTAEGGAVHCSISISKDPCQFLQTLRTECGFSVAVTSSHSGTSALHSTRLPERLALVLGSETHGVSQDILKMAQLKIAISGTGHVESLNVASACAILLNEFARQSQRGRFPAGSPSKPTRTARALGRKRSGS
ncbi:MAG: putative tRNA/rRNA methyltransferase [Pseudomonadota bacterium]|jgi:TrmH RNA methyltransferase